MSAETPDGDSLAASASQFVSFSVAGEMFAVPMAPVQEIIRVPEVARLPLAPPALDGLANLRGRVLPIIRLRRLFQCEARAHDDATRALVIHIGQPLGFVVDRVASVLSVDPDQIEAADGIQSIVGSQLLTGVIKRAKPDGGAEMLLILDFARLIEGQFEQSGRSSDTGTRAAALSTESDTETEASDGRDGSDLRLVSFTVGEQEYALDIAEVQEIVQLPERSAQVPHAPPHLMGVISLRDRLLPLVSLRTLFGLPSVPYSEQQRIVVAALPGGQHVGLVTDIVKEVLSVPREQAEAMPALLAADHQLQEFTRICRLDGGKRLVSIIATDRLLHLPAIDQALAAAHGAASSMAAQDDTTMTQDIEDRDDGREDDDTQLVIFRLGAEEFGVPIMSVQEIVRVPPTLTRIPRTPAFVEGVINLRGTVLPVIDQRSRLGMGAIERNEAQRIMVYTLGGLRTGFIVDSVAEVLRVPRSQVAPAPAFDTEQSALISQVAKLQGDKRLVLLIDPAHLLQRSELQAIERTLDAPSAEARTEAQPAPLARAA